MSRGSGIGQLLRALLRGRDPGEEGPRRMSGNLTIRVGPKSHPIADYAEASRMTLKAVDELIRTGARLEDSFTPPLIFEGDRQVAYVSSNGRVWEGHPSNWSPGTTLLFEMP